MEVTDAGYSAGALPYPFLYRGGLQSVCTISLVSNPNARALRRNRDVNDRMDYVRTIHLKPTSGCLHHIQFQEKHMEAAKTYREGLGQQKMAQYSEKPRLIGGV